MVAFWMFSHCECTFYTLAHSKSTCDWDTPPCLDSISSGLIVRGPFPCPFINSCVRHAVRCSCSSVPDGQTWSIPTECVNLSSLSTSVAGAKSLQMPHRFPLFSASHFSASFFPSFFFLSSFTPSPPSFVLLLSAQSGHCLKEACLCCSQAHGSLVAPLFSFPLPLFPLNTPGKFAFVSDISFFPPSFSCPADHFLFPLINLKLCQDSVNHFDF